MMIDDSGNKVSAENYIFDTLNNTGIFVESFLDNSFFVGVAGYPPNTINVQFFNANLQKIYTANSSYFNNGTCQVCLSPFQVTIGKIYCAKPISNCTVYSGDGKCLTCNNLSFLTIRKFACVQEITNCSTYVDDGKCNACSHSWKIVLC